MWYVMQVQTGNEGMIIKLCEQVINAEKYERIFLPKCVTLKKRCGEWKELIQTLFFHKMDNGVVLFCLSYDRAHRSVLTSVQHKKLVDCLAGTKRLKHRIASLYF